MGAPFEETAHLPVPAGVGLEDAQLCRVVGDGRDRRRDGQSAVPCWLVVGVVCCCAPHAKVHAGKRNFRPVSRATERILVFIFYPCSETLHIR